ncbi:LysR family transcriptional regulator [Erwiniaceae bacterium BAC15a-03b]|uniref:LysR family transcriptional regulator n=1 Tax=Winslowiella arboricola TaxID=2978220 RepID=A0A9J6PTN2_9GAMM|nr:LysR family transcriptional regulator [Winslowiella arboricola]MCU5772523.1 LysR family transcriptional regulator [Winslowiella arboricola]MCU5779045.1 LysR family transcriptional regulator [Winslowiella arboricola]
MRRTNISDIIAFTTTVETSSFAGAARALGLSRSAVAKAVGRIETRLGVRLFNRTTRSLSVTEEGRRFYEQCTVILDDLASAENNIAGRDARPKGLLRITAPGAYGQLHVMPVVRDFLTMWPEVAIELNLTDQTVDIVEEGFDLAIRIGETSDLHPDVVTRVIARYRTMFCAAPEYLEKYGTPQTLESLRSHLCLPYINTRTSVAREHVWRVLTSEGTWQTIPGRIAFMANRGEAVLDAALSGMGIAWLPSFLSEQHVAEGRLVPVLSDYKSAELPVMALYPTKRYLPARVRVFIDTLVAAIRLQQESDASHKNSPLRKS